MGDTVLLFLTICVPRYALSSKHQMEPKNVSVYSADSEVRISQQTFRPTFLRGETDRFQDGHFGVRLSQNLNLYRSKITVSDNVGWSATVSSISCSPGACFFFEAVNCVDNTLCSLQMTKRIKVHSANSFYTSHTLVHVKGVMTQDYGAAVPDRG